MVALRYESPFRLSTSYQNPISIIISVSVNYKGFLLSPIENQSDLPAKTTVRVNNNMPVYGYNVNPLTFILSFIASERATCNAIP